MVLAPTSGMGYGPGMGYGQFPGYPVTLAYSPGMGYGPLPGYPVTLATDQSIARMVVNSINTDPGVPSDANITVDVEGGIVTLTGSVPTKFAKHRAGDDAWWLPDVIDVHNQLQVVSRRNRGQQGQQSRQRQPQGQGQAH